MPISGVLAAERVNDAGNSQPNTDEWIRVNVGVIVVVDEAVAEGLTEHEPRDCNEKNRDDGTRRARIVHCNVRILRLSHRFDLIERGVLLASRQHSNVDKDASHWQIGKLRPLCQGKH